jgi:hypothetical protein
MPVVNFFACLDLDQNISLLNRHYEVLDIIRFKVKTRNSKLYNTLLRYWIFAFCLNITSRLELFTPGG